MSDTAEAMWRLSVAVWADYCERYPETVVIDTATPDTSYSWSYATIDAMNQLRDLEATDE